MIQESTLTRLRAAKTIEEFIKVKRDLSVVERAEVESSGLIVEVLGKDTYESNARIHEAGRLAKQQAAELEEIEEGIEVFIGK